MGTADAGLPGFLLPAGLEDLRQKNDIAPEVALGQAPGFQDQPEQPV
jgi:hypothetical protein